MNLDIWMTPPNTVELNVKFQDSPQLTIIPPGIIYTPLSICCYTVINSFLFFFAHIIHFPSNMSYLETYVLFVRCVLFWYFSPF